jgi:hypothetical protein
MLQRASAQYGQAESKTVQSIRQEIGFLISKIKRIVQRSFAITKQ